MLEHLLNKFWIWTQLPEDDWWKTDLLDNKIMSEFFPQEYEICIECQNRINTQLSPKEMDMFLMGMTIDAEYEDILDLCVEHASDDFILAVVRAGVSFPQADLRWQLTELLRRDIPDREMFLDMLLSDPHPYVRKRAKNVIQDLKGSVDC